MKKNIKKCKYRSYKNNKSRINCAKLERYTGYTHNLLTQRCENCTEYKIKKLACNYLQACMKIDYIDLLECSERLLKLGGKEEVKEGLLNLARSGHKHNQISEIVKKLKLNE